MSVGNYSMKNVSVLTSHWRCRVTRNSSDSVSDDDKIYHRDVHIHRGP